MLNKVCDRAPFPISGIAYCSCQFDVGKYDGSAFDFYGILFPVELSNSVRKRKMEFLAGRYCAKNALNQLGITFFQVAINNDRSPKWPQNMVGSITHSSKTAASMIGLRSEFIGLGIDCEDIITLRQAQQLQDQILTECERGIIDGCSIDFEIFVTLAFSAKECLFKALYPSIKTFMNFDDCFIKEIKSKTLVVCLGKSVSDRWEEGICFEVNYKLEEAQVITCLSLPV